MDATWRIELFGELRGVREHQSISRFRTYKNGALLGYLAYHLGQAIPRDVLADIFWPDSDVDAGRRSLRVALTSLRHQFEPPEVTEGSVLIASRGSVRLNPLAVTTDVALFTAAVEAAAQAADPAEAASRLREAVDLYHGELLCGYYEDWLFPERERLLRRCTGALVRLSEIYQSGGDSEQALVCAERAVRGEPLSEAACAQWMRLLAAAGRPAEALRRYREVAAALDEAGERPGAPLQALAREIEARGANAPATVAPGARRSATSQDSPVVGRNGEAVVSVPSPPAAPPFRNRLPLILTRFFGREEELARLEALLAPPMGDGTKVSATHHPGRLVTLTGPGGSGKSRLALEAVRRLAPLYHERVWFVPLADVAETPRLPSAIHAAMRLPAGAEDAALEQVTAAFARRPALLVLDNLEQLLPGAATVVFSLLQRVPSLALLVTSRRRVALAGEHEVPVTPLPLPQGDDLAGVLSSASSQLFMDRAQAERPDFRVTSRSAPALAAICRRLEGLPLAIELAAAHANVLSLPQMAERLADRFALLERRKSRREPRHPSLWAAIDWSFSLLSPEMRRFFASLSVFRGSWTAEAAADILVPPTAEDPDEERFPRDRDARDAAAHRTLESLGLLRAQSLVLLHDNDSEIRFRMLESVREYAATRLSPDELALLNRRHAEFYLALAEQGESVLWREEHPGWLELLRSEQENMRSAMAWCLENDPEAGLRLAGALGLFWRFSNRWHDGSDWLARFLERTDAVGSTLPRAKARLMLGKLATARGDFAAARALLGEARAAYGELEDARGVVRVVASLGEVGLRQGDYEFAQQRFEEVLALTRELADEERTYKALHSLAVVAFLRKEYAAARSFCEQSLALALRAGNQRGAAGILNLLAESCTFLNDRPAARARRQEALAIYHELGDGRGMAEIHHYLGWAAEEDGDACGASSHYEKSLELFREQDDPWGTANLFLRMGNLCRRQGMLPAAREHLEAACALAREVGDRCLLAQALFYAGHAFRHGGDPSVARERYRECLLVVSEIGNPRDLADVLSAYASFVAEEALRSTPRGKGAATAVRLLAAVEQARPDIPLGHEIFRAFSPEESRGNAPREALRATLSAAAFNSAWSEGAALSIEDAAEQAAGGRP